MHLIHLLDCFCKCVFVKSQFVVSRQYFALERFVQFADSLHMLGQLPVHQLPALRPVILLLLHQPPPVPLIHELQLSLEISHLLQPLLIMDLNRENSYCQAMAQSQQLTLRMTLRLRFVHILLIHHPPYMHTVMKTCSFYSSHQHHPIQQILS